MKELKIPVSIGELYDKISILELKEQYIKDEAKRVSIQHELIQLYWEDNDLRKLILKTPFIGPTGESMNGIEAIRYLDKLITDLKECNRQLWHIEDKIRGYEARGDIEIGVNSLTGMRDPSIGDRNALLGFIGLARSVYRVNDTRSELKRQINKFLGSFIVEEKSYKSY